jgi:GntR family transcriptional regulator/MocR family aminotransferase
LERQPYVRLNFTAESSGRPLSGAQIVAIMRGQIAGEPSLAGCRLPPVRVLAHQLGVSKNTVQAAYDELQAQGLVESKDRTGLFVARGREPRPVAAARPQSVPVPELRRLPFVAAAKSKINLGAPGAAVQLSSVFVDPELLPLERMAACFRSVLRSPGLPEFHDPQGMPALRAKIAERLRERGVAVDPEHVIITNGSQQALDVVTRALATRVVATEEPSYYLGRYLLEMNGIRTVGLPIDPFRGMDATAWRERLATERPGLAYLTTNFQNPNGYSYTSAEIARIVEWARDYGFGILEDDWGYEMLSYSEFKPGLRAMGGDAVLYMNSFTKKLLPSLRIGYLAANAETIDALQMAKRASTIAVPGVIEAALFEFLDRGYYDQHLKLIQSELDVRYEHCLGLLTALMPPEVRWTSPGGGPVLWLEVPRRVDLGELAHRLEAQGVLVQLATSAYQGAPAAHGFKIGYAFLGRAVMEQALVKLAAELGRQIRS